jgi:hypothetical protein
MQCCVCCCSSNLTVLDMLSLIILHLLQTCVCSLFTFHLLVLSIDLLQRAATQHRDQHFLMVDIDKIFSSLVLTCTSFSEIHSLG